MLKGSGENLRPPFKDFLNHKTKFMRIALGVLALQRSWSSLKPHTSIHPPNSFAVTPLTFLKRSGVGEEQAKCMGYVHLRYWERGDRLRKGWRRKAVNHKESFQYLKLFLKEKIHLEQSIYTKREPFYLAVSALMEKDWQRNEWNVQPLPAMFHLRSEGWQILVYGNHLKH